MKGGFFSKIAFTGIKKNKKLYIPYIFTCIGMITMFYIISAMADTPLLLKIGGGRDLRFILDIGKWVIGAFSLLFLFYTNSFLMHRRNKELGLYNILGMDKKSIGKIVLYESLIISLVSLALGLCFGVSLSKLAEMGLMKIIHGNINYALRISGNALMNTLKIFAAIFVLLLLNSLRHVCITKPLDMLRSENVGEKPPKANWILAVVGIILLGSAYYFAVTIKSPIEALKLFFLAVIMVIVATYMLLTAGSVTLCRFLQKKKVYYYKKNHFVSVSSMAYRMRRNGAGLASICILSTMILVMITGSLSLYIGLENAITTMYPRDICTTVSFKSVEGMQEGNIEKFRNVAKIAAESNNAVIGNVRDFRTMSIYGIIKNGLLRTNPSGLDKSGFSSLDSLYCINFVSLSDYNRLNRANEVLADNEAMIYCDCTEFDNEIIKVPKANTLKIVKRIDSFRKNEIYKPMPVSTVYIVISNFNDYCTQLCAITDSSAYTAPQLEWYYEFDVDCGAQTTINIQNQIVAEIRNLNTKGKCMNYFCESREGKKSIFYESYGGLLFIGVVLSIVFVFAAALIIYYKQISEGYEDQSRFEIMQHVGMTNKDIRKSINSQILIVFFIPLILAGIHLSFAFPLVWKLLVLFGINDITKVILTSIVAFVIFGIFYTIVYNLTAKAYFNIVSIKTKKYI